jgi:formylmethanofuran:tetrahydromethanopterin formyltransferase
VFLLIFHKNVEIDTIYDESISWMKASLASLLISAQEVLLAIKKVESIITSLLTKPSSKSTSKLYMALLMHSNHPMLQRSLPFT